MLYIRADGNAGIGTGHIMRVYPLRKRRDSRASYVHLLLLTARWCG